MRRAIFLVAFIATSALAQETGLAIAFDSPRVTITGVTPGADVVIFAVVREPHDHYVSLLRREAVLTDTDRDGRVEYTSPAPVPWTSVWCAVDMDSGRYAIQSPFPFALNVLQLPQSALRRNGAGATDSLVFSMAQADFLLVRTRDGAWTGLVMDGGRGDTDAKNDGSWRALFENSHGIGPVKKDKPKHLLPHDLLILIDSNALDVYVATPGNEVAF
jgi:hypothetical protein